MVDNHPTFVLVFSHACTHTHLYNYAVPGSGGKFSTSGGGGWPLLTSVMRTLTHTHTHTHTHTCKGMFFTFSLSYLGTSIYKFSGLGNRPHDTGDSSTHTTHTCTHTRLCVHIHTKAHSFLYLCTNTHNLCTLWNCRIEHNTSMVFKWSYWGYILIFTMPFQEDGWLGTIQV